MKQNALARFRDSKNLSKLVGSFSSTSSIHENLCARPRCKIPNSEHRRSRRRKTRQESLRRRALLDDARLVFFLQGAKFEFNTV